MSRMSEFPDQRLEENKRRFGGRFPPLVSTEPRQMTKQEGIKEILTEDLIICNITHENAPPGKDCYDDCGTPRLKGSKKHRRCMECWEEYVDDLATRIVKIVEVKDD